MLLPAGRMLLACLIVLSASVARSEERVLKIGVLDDMSGPYADLSGQGSVIAAKLAVEDFGAGLGRKIEIVSADHMNKADAAVAIAKRWIEAEGVEMITGLSNSAVALAARNVASSNGKIDIVVNAGSSDLSGKACTPTSFHWVYDSYGLAKTVGMATIRSGADTFYQVLVDYAFATAMGRDGSRFAEAAGGKPVGSVRVPLNTADYSSFILQAQSSKAKAILLALAGADFINFVKQAHEFGITDSGQKLASFITYANDIHSLGPKTAQGLLSSEAFYWDLDDKTRAFSKRFFAAAKKMPNSMQAGVYSAVMHYLKAVQAAGTTDAKQVVAKMRELPVNDFMTDNGHVREDGRLPRPMYLFQAKSPKESAGDWDILKPIEKLSAEEATRPLSESECPLVKDVQAKK
ncbi:ABC transporter substrate-binding protein [Bradyrhizobium sp. WSM 1704]|uniref:ABC transporter substrate-binding protein n=1 Tax=Bradyrhizobium semiaridum TaxID=2821404 RepID=UPI001CE39E17|nr:ABC transporter substrate-binding protein [Bradyrhizobium semiaridum]MCA6123182.1 ABC transporter substrate-binding protein [Bradyrhizobium semiaridum]